MNRILKILSVIQGVQENVGNLPDIKKHVKRILQVYVNFFRIGLLFGDMGSQRAPMESSFFNIIIESPGIFHFFFNMMYTR